MQEIIVSFAKENLVPLAYAVAWYMLAGFIAALFGRKSRIDAWCEANPGLALVLNFLRATGFDMWKILAALKTIADAKSKIPPIAPAFMLLGALAAGGTQVGCNRATIDAQIDKALLFEDQVIVQVNYLDSVFAQLVVNPALPAEKQADFRAKFAEGKAILMQAMQAKDSALRAAKAANAEVVNLPELVNGIVDAVQQIIQIVAMVGASPVFVQEQQTRAMSLSRGI